MGSKSTYDSEEHKRNYGAYLYDREDYAYWCKPGQYCKAKDYDNSLPDTVEGDDAYFDWFDNFAKSEKIKKEPWKKYVQGKSISSYWTSSSYDNYDDGDWGKNASQSSFGFKGYTAGAGSRTLELASAAQAAQSVVDVISDEENLSVRFIANNETGRDLLSYTIFQNGLIMISPQPFLKEKDMGLDLTSGLALHEGAHGKWTDLAIRNIDDKVGNNDKISEKISHYLANVLEDVRIEKNLIKEYPGFREYLRILHDWVWAEYNESAVPEKYSNLSERMSTLLVAVRYPEKCSLFTDASFDGEIDWWQNWARKYKGASNLEELLYEGHEHLLNGEDLPKEEEVQEPRGACHSHIKGDSSDLTPDDAERIKELVDQDMQVLGGGAEDRAILRRPVENDITKRAAIKNDPLVSRMKEALVFRQAKPQRESNLLEEGDLDEEQLDRVANKDYRVFKTTSITEDVPEVAVTLLVDASGSMFSGYDGTSPIQTASRVATIMVEALKKIKGAAPSVVGYTTSYRTSGIDLTRIWEPGDPVTRLGILSRGLESGGTPTGLALKHIGAKINKDYPEKDRIIIVISDGYPDSFETVRQQVDELRKTGIKIMQVSVGGMRDKDQEHMYGPGGYIPLAAGESPNSIITPLTRWLKRFVV